MGRRRERRRQQAEVHDQPSRSESRGAPASRAGADRARPDPARNGLPMKALTRRRDSGDRTAVLDASRRWRRARRRPRRARGPRHHRLVRQPQGARPGLADHAGRRDHRADRSVRLRQVDLPADPQPDARAGAVGRAGRRGAARRRGHLRPRSAAHRRPPRDRHGLPEAQPVPGDVDPRERARRPQAHRHPGASAQREGRARRALPDQGPASGTRSRTASTPPAAACPAASSSGCASPARWRSSRGCC